MSNSPSFFTDEIACRHTLTRMMYHYDRSEVGETVRHFAEDAVWHHRDNTHEGAKAIREFLELRPDVPPTSHLVTSFFLIGSAGGLAEGRARVMLFHTRQQEEGSRVGEQRGVGEYCTKFRLVGDRWVIVEHKGSELFAL